jgi:superfamily II DNA/RNA helicase
MAVGITGGARCNAKHKVVSADVQKKHVVLDLRTWLGLGVELRPEITAALRRLGFGKPTPIQAKALPLAITEDRDLIGGAQTGSGKTLAFGIPIMQVRAPAAAATCASSWALTAAVPRRRCWG